MKIVMSKFPYLSSQKEGITNLKKIIALLSNRKQYLGENKASLSPYEQNEQEILLWKTNKELSSAYKDLSDREIKFKELHTFYSDFLDEVSKNFEAIMKEAKKRKDTNEKIKEQLDSFKTIDFEDNWEAKIHLYHKLKELLEYKPKTLSKA